MTKNQAEHDRISTASICTSHYHCAIIVGGGVGVFCKLNSSIKHEGEVSPIKIQSIDFHITAKVITLLC